MELRQLLYFKTIVEEGTISKAAIALHMAQPPLSMQLKSLEDELGVTLLRRLPRRVELTQEGRLFYKRALQILELSEQTAREVQDINYHQKIHIGITSSNGGIMLNPCLDTFKIKYPDLAFEIHEGNTYEMIDEIKSHLIDLAIIRTPFDSTGLSFKYLLQEPMIAIGGGEYLKDTKHITLSDMMPFPLIIYRRYERIIQEACLNQHLVPNIICKNDDCRTSLLWANMHKGIAIVPQSALSLYAISEEIKKVPILEQELYTSVAIVWRNDQDLSALIKEFIDAFNPLSQ